MPKDIVNGKITEDSIARVEDDHVERLARHKIEQGDLLFSRRGDVGRCALVSERESGWLCGTGCLRVGLDCAKVDSRFVYNYMSLPDSAKWLESHAVGATMPNINPGILENTPLSLPPLPIQRKIADILGAYDDLIENNRRRIELLEKMARELYRERFVRRGGESQEEYPLEQIAKFVRGKVIVKDATRPGTVPVVAGGLEPAYYHDTANTSAPVVTVSGSGANAGFSRMYFEEIWASDCSWVDVTRTKYIRFVYCFLKDNDAELRNKQQGAAQPHVHAKDVNSLLLKASEDDIVAFEKLATPLFDELANLSLQNRNLARQRDRLLPRLMNGRLDVSQLVTEGA